MNFLYASPFENSILDAKRGWSNTAKFVEEFPEIAEFEREFKQLGVTMITEVDASTPEHASLTIADHDGGTILVDQQR